MKAICFVSLMNSEPWGGSEELWYQTALFAVQNNYAVDCIVYNDENKKTKLEALKTAGGRIFYLPNKGKQKKGVWQKAQYKFNKKISIPRFLKTILFENYDHVVVNQGEFELSYSTWENLWRRLSNYTILFHNYRETQKMSSGGLRRLQAWVQHASANLFASRRIAEVLETLMHEKIPRTGLLLNPITFATQATPKPWPALQNGNYVFVTLAALDTKRKAQDLLIIALSAPQWKERNWQLHLYGSGPDKEKLLASIKNLGLQNRVLLKGHTGEVENVLSNAHLLCQMSRVDAMPISVVEAMACARPVLVTPIGDMPFWIKDGGNGYVSREATTAGIQQTLERAWEQRENWERMGVDCFRAFKQRYPEDPRAHFLKQVFGSMEATP